MNNLTDDMQETQNMLERQARNGVRFETTAPVGMASLEKRYTCKQIRDVIHRRFGIFTCICNELDCTFYALSRYIRKHGLEQDVNEARQTITELAQDALLTCLNSDDLKVKLDAAKFTLKSLGKDKGWSDSPNLALSVSVEDGKEKERKIRAIFGMTASHDNTDGNSTSVSEEVHNTP